MDEAILRKLLDSNTYRLEQVPMKFIRDEGDRISWNSRMVTLLGARGTGKTTMLLQQIKLHDPDQRTHLYLALDDTHFITHTLTDTVRAFYQLGYNHFYLDEVHKYATWSKELKSLYDTYNDIRIAFTGSSALEVLKGEADLSRRTLIYKIQGLSFREYLALFTDIHLPKLSLEDFLLKPNEYLHALPQDFKPYQYFRQYLQLGYYPFSAENPEETAMKLNQVVRLIIEYDLPSALETDVYNTRKLFQLLVIIAHSVPFKPNISKLSERIGISRNTLLQYLSFLRRADLVNAITVPGKSTSILQKPDKLYLENTNLMYTLAETAPNTGTLRETFVLNQLSFLHTVEYPKKGDFLVDGKYTLEVGGPGKDGKQIKGLKNSFILSDSSEWATLKSIPLWLAGMLY